MLVVYSKTVISEAVEKNTEEARLTAICKLSEIKDNL